MTPTIIAVIAVIIVILLLRSFSEKKIEMPGGSGGYAPPPLAGDEPSFEAIEGEVDGVPYTADVYDNDSVTVSIEIDEPLQFAGEVDARGGRPGIKDDVPFKQEAEELLTLGAVYIDVTGENDWIAADFPLSTGMDAALAGKAARLLVRIRRKACPNSASGIRRAEG